MGNTIHPTASIGENVELGIDNHVGPYVVIDGPTQIGDGNWFGAHCAIGAPAQWSGTTGIEIRTSVNAGVVIGSRNVIREFVTIHQGTDRQTSVGNEVYLMAYAHVPHDSAVLDRAVITNAVQMGGYSVVGWNANLGLGSVVQQRRVIGPYAMIGMHSTITNHVPPGALVVGSPARIVGVNRVGLTRAGFTSAQIVEIETCLRGRELVYNGANPAYSAAVVWYLSQLPDK